MQYYLLTNPDKCDIIYTERKKEVTTMEKVIRICEITGRMTVVATNLTTEQAMALVRERAQVDPYGEYRRVLA